MEFVDCRRGPILSKDLRGGLTPWWTKINLEPDDGFLIVNNGPLVRVFRQNYRCLAGKLIKQGLLQTFGILVSATTCYDVCPCFYYVITHLGNKDTHWTYLFLIMTSSKNATDWKCTSGKEISTSPGQKQVRPLLVRNLLGFAALTVRICYSVRNVSCCCC